jgi:hypothetical protein
MGWPIDSTHYCDEYLASPKRWKYVASLLYKKGYSFEDLKKILGLNFLRVYKAVLPGFSAPLPLTPESRATLKLGQIFFAWIPSIARGVKAPDYKFNLEVREADGTYSNVLEKVISGSSLSLKKPLDAGKAYRWRISAESGLNATNADWSYFDVQKEVPVV